MRARIRPYHARLRQEIERYGGTVEKFVGDAVMAAFGAPVAHEDDAERAVRAGLSILEAIAGAERGRSRSRPAGAGGDQHGRGGCGGRRPPGARGGARDRRRRQHGRPHPERGAGERGRGRRADLPSDEPRVRVRAAPAGLGEREGGAAVRSGGRRRSAPASGPTVIRDYTTPFVGRELEKPLLVGIFERAAQQRSVQLVTIVGEPGVGKSRLVAELFAYIDAEARAHPLAAGTLPALRRGDHLLGARARSSRPRQASSSRTPPKSPRRSWTRPSRARSPSGSGCCSGWRRSSESRRLAGRAAGAVHGLAPLPRGSGCRRPERARVRGPALGRRGAARLPRAPGRVVAGGAAARRLHGPARALRAPAGLGRRTAQRAHDQPLAALETRRRPSSSPHLAHEHRPQPRSSSERSSSARAATRSMRRSSCACSQTAASITGETPSPSRRCPRACRR